MIASWTQIYYTNLSKQRKLGLKIHIADKFDRSGRRLIDWRIDSLLAADFETKNIPQALPLQFALQKIKETTRTLCRENFSEILTRIWIHKYDRPLGRLRNGRDLLIRCSLSLGCRIILRNFTIILHMGETSGGASQTIRAIGSNTILIRFKIDNKICYCASG